MNLVLILNFLCSILYSRAIFCEVAGYKDGEHGSVRSYATGQFGDLSIDSAGSNPGSYIRQYCPKFLENYVKARQEIQPLVFLPLLFLSSALFIFDWSPVAIRHSENPYVKITSTPFEYICKNYRPSQKILIRLFEIISEFLPTFIVVFYLCTMIINTRSYYSVFSVWNVYHYYSTVFLILIFLVTFMSRHGVRLKDVNGTFPTLASILVIYLFDNYPPSITLDPEASLPTTMDQEMDVGNEIQHLLYIFKQALIALTLSYIFSDEVLGWYHWNDEKMRKFREDLEQASNMLFESVDDYYEGKQQQRLLVDLLDFYYNFDQSKDPSLVPDVLYQKLLENPKFAGALKRVQTPGHDHGCQDGKKITESIPKIFDIVKNYGEKNPSRHFETAVEPLLL